MYYSCSNCHREKPWHDFGSRSDGKPKSWCKLCNSKASRATPERRIKAAAASRAWRDAHPGWDDKHKLPRLLRKYGMTAEEWIDLNTTAAGTCEICGKRPDPDGKANQRVLHVDHDHATGTVRGLLCSICNQRLGIIELPGFVEAAQQYLERKKK